MPDGCLDSLAGPWVHALDPSYRYQAEDDGGTLTLLVTRQFIADAGFSPRRFRHDGGAPEDAGRSEPVDAGPEPVRAPDIRVELQRTAGGFVGSTLATVTHPSGRSCEARFPTSILSCADGGLLLETSAGTALGDACQAPARPQAVPRLQHPLIRPADAR